MSRRDGDGVELNGGAQRPYALRKFAEKVGRKVKRLAGRPDNSPWIMEPRPTPRTAMVDFIFALDYLSPGAEMLRIMHEAMSAYGLSFLLVNKTNVEKVTKDVEAGYVRPSVYLDLSSYTGDAFENLLYTCARHGVHTLRRPEHTKWILKASAHEALERAGIPVPPTVIFKRNDPDRELTPEELRKVGPRVVIKPSNGGANKGVVIGVAPTAEAIAQARDFNRADDWLVQRMMTWDTFDNGRSAYVRAYGICGERTLLWWSFQGETAGYAPLTWADLEKYELWPAVKLIDRVAKLTGMDYFSVEIAIGGDEMNRSFTLIDYVNDQCDLNYEAHPIYSPPVGFTRWGCRRLAEFVWRKKTGKPADEMCGLHLFDCQA